jgi:putative membrane protein
MEGWPNSAAALTRSERVLLWVLVAFTVAAVGGFWVFGMHPERIAASALAARVYGAAFVVFARGQILLAAAALFFVLVRRAGTTWITAFLAIYALSLASELSGTTVGLPFGPYHYTDGLGPKWFGHVPVLIPLSWFLMAVPSFAIARRLTGHGSSAISRILIGSLVLLSWDLALDPAMSHATKYWIWGDGATGPYYGMPWLNLFGWYVTGVALMIVLEVRHANLWLDAIPIRWLAGFYIANLALSLGMAAAAGLVGAVAASLIPIAACVIALRGSRGGIPVTRAPLGAR